MMDGILMMILALGLWLGLVVLAASAFPPRRTRC